MAQAEILPFTKGGAPAQPQTFPTQAEDWWFQTSVDGSKHAVCKQLSVSIMPYGEASRMYLRRYAGKTPCLALIAELGSMRVEVSGRDISFTSRTCHAIVRDGYIARCEGGMAAGSYKQVLFVHDGEIRCYMVGKQLFITPVDLKFEKDPA